MFIPVAEETGLIIPLGKYVLTQACSWLGTWRKRNPDYPPLTLSVNVSARQLRDVGLASHVSNALEEWILATSGATGRDAWDVAICAQR
jgi:EAL domain-containing protein (putative c-di-GMP-specific phosphodiesterase class I)